MQKTIILIVILAFMLPVSLISQKKKKKDAEEVKTEQKDPLSSSTFSGLKLRNIGPALTSGRIIDFAVNPKKHSEYYVAVASGGVWKTTNAGTTYKPIFDSQKSYSIGCVTIDPNNTNVIWVGSGENNGQRSIAYGDGVYKSEDGGKSWKNMGLKTSEHIGKIVVHPKNSDVVYVAAQGPLWKEGGERGLYQTTDGGKSWDAILTVDEHTGVNDIVMDPRDPNVMYATTWQRRRHVWTYISGGPGSGLHKTIDGGKTWTQIKKGLPSVDIGRIGLAISPANPDYVYAIVEAADGKGGFFRSTDRGVSWTKRSSYSSSGNYYQEIICDPLDVNRVYSMNTWAQVTDDGGKTFRRVGEKSKHVDNHALWINPNDTDHLLMGCDGGIYESFDRGANWIFKPNLPITQFYKVVTDNDAPFYNVYGGTQDNFSLGGPSRTTNTAGIVNSDWYITNGGDGFESAVDPENPDIVYAQSQYGNLVRYDRKSGEIMDIQPQAGKGEPGLRWNWDAPLLISPHSNTRLYFAANKLFRSEDRGNSWKAISPDLTRQIDRNKLPVMGRVWSMDAVAKNASTTIYGNIVALSESPVKENLIYVGTDDGLVQVTENAGENWRKVESFTGVPANTYVNSVLASQHDENVVYAAFNNHKNGDFKPYLLKSTDKGQSWTSIANNLPERGSVYAIAEDHVAKDLLFVGTEFGLFFSRDGGKKWIQLKGGLPTIAIRDIDIQKRENDLVLASFGRGFYILDDYSPLRTADKEVLAKEAHIFPIKDSWMFIESAPLGLAGKSFQGESYYTAENPPVGAVFTYYLKESILTKKQERQKKEKELVKKKEAVSYPSFEEMRAEDNEQKPYLLFTITDEAGKVVRRLKTGATKGLKRIHWDFRYPHTNPVSLRSPGLPNPFSSKPKGPMAIPGTYYVSMSKSVNGVITEIVPKQPFNIKPLDNVTLPAEDKAQVLAFQEKVSDLDRAIRGASQLYGELNNKLRHIEVAIRETPDAPLTLTQTYNSIRTQMHGIQRKLMGDRSVARRQFETPSSIMGRVSRIVYGLWEVRSAPTKTQEDAYAIAAEEFGPVMQSLKKLAEEDMKGLEKQLEAAGAPWTPGRVPVWTKE